jgi:hypothetical protein
LQEPRCEPNLDVQLWDESNAAMETQYALTKAFPLEVFNVEAISRGSDINTEPDGFPVGENGVGDDVHGVERHYMELAPREGAVARADD